MDIVDFSDKYFHEIEQQDNPAFDPKVKDGLKCVLITKDGQYLPTGFRVMLIAKQAKTGETALSVGVFWKLEMARLFAEQL